MVNRLSNAFFSVGREEFYCIKKFDLCKQVGLVFIEHGKFIPSPEKWITTMPYQRVAKYVITSAFQVEMKTAGHLNARKQAMKDPNSPLHDKKQMAIDAEKKKENGYQAKDVSP